MLVQRAGILKGKFAGNAGIVLGNSPSVNMVDPKYFDPFITIGVNRILRSEITPNFILFCDKGVVDRELPWFKLYEGNYIIYDHLHF